MISPICCGKAIVLAAVCSFAVGLLFLRQTQSSLEFEPRIKPAPLSTLSADTVCAIGDLHGDLEQGYTALRLAGVVNVQGSWSGGKATLVQTGDLLDRGPNSLGLVELFERLKVDPKADSVVFCTTHQATLQHSVLQTGRGKQSWWSSAHSVGQSRSNEPSWGLQICQPNRAGSTGLSAGATPAYTPGC